MFQCVNPVLEAHRGAGGNGKLVFDEHRVSVWVEKVQELESN